MSKVRGGMFHRVATMHMSGRPVQNSLLPEQSPMFKHDSPNSNHLVDDAVERLHGYPQTVPANGHIGAPYAEGADLEPGGMETIKADISADQINTAQRQSLNMAQSLKPVQASSQSQSHNHIHVNSSSGQATHQDSVMAFKTLADHQEITQQIKPLLKPDFRFSDTEKPGTKQERTSLGQSSVSAIQQTDVQAGSSDRKKGQNIQPKQNLSGSRHRLNEHKQHVAFGIKGNHKEQAADPVINITIGQIDIRAEQETPIQKQAAAKKANMPAQKLEAYYQRRLRGQS